MYYEKEQEMINYGEITKFKESTIEKYHSIVYFAILFTVFCVTYHTLSDTYFGIVIGNPLMQSLDFPPLHTVRAAFTAHGVPSLEFSCHNIILYMVQGFVFASDRLATCHGSKIVEFR